MRVLATLFASGAALIFILSGGVGVINLVIAAQDQNMIAGITGVGWLLVSMIAFALVTKFTE